MVHSKINPKIIYEDTKQINPEDYKMLATSYDIVFNKLNPNKTVSVAFGKERNDFIHLGVIYFPMYLVVDNTTKEQIGIFEIPMEKINYIKDSDDDIDPEQIKDPLLYQFVSDSYLSSFSESKDLNLGIIDLDDVENTKPTEQPKKERKSEDEDDDIFKVKLNDKDIEPIKKMNPNSIFIIDTNQNQPPILSEENEDDLNDQDEIESIDEKTFPNKWIQQFMKNKHYKIQDNEGSGDCLFAVIRDAFEQIGHRTTVQKMRDLLAEEATDDIFQEYRSVYLAIENEIIENTKRIENYTKVLKELKKRVEKTIDRIENETILKEGKNLKNQIKKLKEENRENTQFVNYHFGFMQNLDSLDKFKNYIKTSSYWADTWAISTLERLLNIKLVIFSEEAYKEDSKDNVLNCGEINKQIQDKGTFTPNYYILTSYSGQHYRLITYKNKKILTYSEIPYGVKMLVINKCMEVNSGIYYLIQDFRNLKEKMGIPIDKGSPITTEQDDYESLSNIELYDPNIVFMFYNKSQNKPLPGNGSGEKITKDKLILFKELNKVKDWRKKLDDEWSAPFVVDNHRWLSIEHYYQGSKFRKGFPDFYLNFSLDSESDISKDVSLAKKAGSKKPDDTRAKNITLDPDFYGERSLEERELAMRSKFEQNLDLKELLIATYPAKLLNFKRGKEPEVRMSLMKLRKEFIDNRN
jgi:predicted NAD-dependent protein-ADP-ribosyltransferase YbiA (DUF1768 family)